MKYIIKNIEELICILTFVTMLVLGFLNIIVRNFTNYSLASTQEIVINGMVILTVYGAAIAVKNKQLISINLFLNSNNKKIGFVFNYICLSISSITLIYVIYFTFNLLNSQIDSGVHSSALNIPSWIYSIPLPFGFVLVLLRQIQNQINFK